MNYFLVSPFCITSGPQNWWRDEELSRYYSILDEILSIKTTFSFLGNLAFVFKIIKETNLRKEYISVKFLLRYIQ